MSASARIAFSGLAVPVADPYERPACGIAQLELEERDQRTPQWSGDNPPEKSSPVGVFRRAAWVCRRGDRSSLSRC